MNAEKFNLTVLPLQNKMFRFAVSILKSAPDAEDVLQETLVKLWERRNELIKCNNIEAFAMKMVKNLCIDKIRKHKNTNEINDSVLGIGTSNPHQQTELKDMAGLAHSLINQLPPMQQMVMRLRDVEGYELDEIAEIMDIENSAVRTNLSRARQTVRQHLITLQEIKN